MSPSSSNAASPITKPGTFPAPVYDEVIKVTDATSLPPRSRVQIFADAYFGQVYHRAPIIDREDLLGDEPSVLLLQSICLVGSLLRYPKDQPPMALSEPYYRKIKTLFYANHEADSFVVLKAISLLCFWIMTPPVTVSLDTAWHWLGVAVRLAQHMGLHRESSCLKLPSPGAARRVMWFLFVSSGSGPMPMDGG